MNTAWQHSVPSRLEDAPASTAWEGGTRGAIKQRWAGRRGFVQALVWACCAAQLQVTVGLKCACRGQAGKQPAGVAPHLNLLLHPAPGRIGAVGQHVVHLHGGCDRSGAQIRLSPVGELEADGLGRCVWGGRVMHAHSCAQTQQAVRWRQVPQPLTRYGMRKREVGMSKRNTGMRLWNRRSWSPAPGA